MLLAGNVIEVTQSRDLFVPNCADAAANVFFNLSVCYDKKVFASFWGHGRPSLVNFRHHGHGFTFKKWMPWLIRLS